MVQKDGVKKKVSREVDKNEIRNGRGDREGNEIGRGRGEGEI